MKMRHAKSLVMLLTACGLIAVTLITLLLFVPTFKEVTHLSNDITLAHAELDAQYANRKNLLSSLIRAENARGDMQKLATQFVRVGRELDFITAVENLAAKNGVEEHIALSTADSAKAAVELRENYDLTVNGKYRSVLQALVDLEKMPTLLIIDSLVVRPGPGATPDDQSFLSVVMHGSLASPPNGL